MRWDSLFDDLESQLEWERSAEDLELRAEEERLRLGRLSLRDRLIGIGPDESSGRPAGTAVRLILRSGRTVSVLPTTFGRDWIAADLVRAHGVPGGCIIPLSGIASVLLAADDVERSLSVREPVQRGPRITDRIGLPFVLRDLCRRRSYVTVCDSTGHVGGTLDRVARDHVDVAVHPRGTPRRASEVTQIRIVALAGIELVEL
ncbi:hypothetical protein SAMN04489806_2391 [Paramicrobacterium humi]|uniref:Uncharacterized protein n=1 Tax=Paramicrobacterium humi TaxID=640635 RepID=A0A1H4P4M3_9MICO|nr:hypothetical protein [Microbacterium humi]SEC02245.1 hypothetical protein SAMN04489806_2391 [Microbacterium humi]